jgi:hypothetical protein
MISKKIQEIDEIKTRCKEELMLLASGFWLLASGFWLLASGFCFFAF